MARARPDPGQRPIPADLDLELEPDRGQAGIPGLTRVTWSGGRQSAGAQLWRLNFLFLDFKLKTKTKTKTKKIGLRRRRPARSLICAFAFPAISRDSDESTQLMARGVGLQKEESAQRATRKEGQ
jgi:hypothetical protein